MSLTLLLLIPVLLLGLAVGSFLNVVIYRLPRDLSVAQPRWSFCPHCHANIRWFDNVPVLGWLRLRARCRDCGEAISLQYPIIELLTALVFVATYDALFIGRAISHISGATADGVLFVAYLFLLASLLANAVIDLEAYIIDVRLTYWAMAVGVVCNVLWPALGGRGVLPDVRFSVAATAMGLTVIATFWYATRRYRRELAEAEPPPPEPETSPAEAPPQSEPTAPHGPLPVVLLATVVLAISAAPFCASWMTTGTESSAFAVRAAASLAVICFVLILAAMQSRPADAEMAHTLEVERPAARRVAMLELCWLLPTIAAGVAAYLLVPERIAASGWRALFSEPHAMLPRVLAGGADGLIGLMSGAVLGWGVRIFFTLVFGKEAFGAGDIYLLAAIGAVGGPWVCIIAFFAACLLALLGVAASLFRKSCRAIPFGPWLAVGTLVALWVKTPVAATVGPAFTTLWRMLTRQPVDF